MSRTSSIKSKRFESADFDNEEQVSSLNDETAPPKSSVKNNSSPKSRSPRPDDETSRSTSSAGRSGRAKSVSLNDLSPEAQVGTPIANASISPRKSRSRQEEVEDKNTASSEFEDLRSLLDKKGYTILRGISIGNDEGSTISYVVATILGNIVYIDLDTKYTNLQPRSKDLAIKRVIQNSQDEVEDEITASKCATLGSCGTVYECNDGFCTLQRDVATMGIQKSHFSVVSKRTSQNVQDLDDTYPAYPMVKLSEILTDNFEVIKIIERETNRLDAEAVKVAIERRMKLRLAISRLSRAMDPFEKLMNGAQTNVLSALAAAHRTRVTLKFPPLESQKEQYAQVLHKVMECRRKFESLIRQSRILDEITRDLDEVYQEIASIFKEFQIQYDIDK
jgi:hypothetical protein